MVDVWIEWSACNTEYTGSTLVRDSYCVGTLSKSLTHNCSAVLQQAVPLRCALFALRVKGRRLLEKKV